MDPLIDQFADKGVVGLVALAVLWMLREQIAAALKPTDRVGPAEMKAALTENTAALKLMHEDFKANNGLFKNVLQEVQGVSTTLENIRVEIVRGNGINSRSR